MAQKHALTGDVTIYAVCTLRTRFEGWIAKLPKGRRAAELSDSPLIVDAAGVNEVDAAGIQLLLALSKSLLARRRQLQLVNPSSALVGACDALGVSALLFAPLVEGTAA